MPPSGSWSAQERLVAPDVDAGDGIHDVAVDGGGSIYAVWRRYDNPNSYFGRAYGAVRPPGGPAHAPAPLSGTGRNVWPPVLATNPAIAGAVVAYPAGWRIEMGHARRHEPARTAGRHANRDAGADAEAGRDERTGGRHGRSVQAGAVCAGAEGCEPRAASREPPDGDR